MQGLADTESVAFPAQIDVYKRQTLCRGNVYLKQSYSQNICVPLTSDEIHMELDIAINVN